MFCSDAADIASVCLSFDGIAFALFELWHVQRIFDSIIASADVTSSLSGPASLDAWAWATDISYQVRSMWIDVHRNATGRTSLSARVVTIGGCLQFIENMQDNSFHQEITVAFDTLFLTVALWVLCMWIPVLRPEACPGLLT